MFKLRNKLGVGSMHGIIAEHLSVRHIIVRARRARRALMEPYSEVVLVCMYVCLSVTGLRLKYTIDV